MGRGPAAAPTLEARRKAAPSEPLGRDVWDPASDPAGQAQEDPDQARQTPSGEYVAGVVEP